MNKVLIYCRPKSSEYMAEQTANILYEQLQQIGLDVDISHSLNLPRLILNSYQTVHFIIENLPLSVNEIIQLAICRALGKSTIISVLNSDNKINRSVLDFVKPDAFSVSQTNHLKIYRNITCNKFILPAFPKTDVSGKKNNFNGQAFLIPLQNNIDEAFDCKIGDTVYFDGRKLLKKQGASQLRKKWNELLVNKKINPTYHLVLSDTKLGQLITEESLIVVLSDPNIKHTEFADWLGKCMNKNNLIVLNDFQATGFSNYWTSGHNCLVISAINWMSQLEHLENSKDLITSAYKPSELFEPTVNDLSRLYSKLWQQKTSLLTSGSVKL